MAKATRAIDKVTARVFCQRQGGGNPVTIFDSPSFLSSATQKRLAQSCQWESVMVDRNLRKMSFFMPTGEQVSFCAHAAMGGALQLGSTGTNTTTSTDNTAIVDFTASLQSDTTYKAVLHEHDIVSLAMSTKWEESRIAVPPTLYRILRDKIGLSRSDLSPLAMNAVLPTFCNASIARPKTLVHVPSLQTLHEASAPSIENDSFRVACDAIESTGIYLYTKRLDDEDDNHNNSSEEMYSSWECRQFPRASGYPEDPATGIAAAALAASIDHRRLRHLPDNKNSSSSLGLSTSPRYKFYQGTAMGQASLIMVENLQWDFEDNESSSSDDNTLQKVSFQLVGRVEVDSQETITIKDEQE